jgi:Tfp pilus assembly protein PilV
MQFTNQEALIAVVIVAAVVIALATLIYPTQR